MLYGKAGCPCSSMRPDRTVPTSKKNVLSYGIWYANGGLLTTNEREWTIKVLR